jgi:hypothetical protein
MAIVGSRRGTPYGLRMAERLGADLGGRGVTVVSGLARGVDTAAHRGALDAGGRTLAVLGSGVDVVYPPENRGLAAEVVKVGAVLSQFPMGTAPLPYHFRRGTGSSRVSPRAPWSSRPRSGAGAHHRAAGRRARPRSTRCLGTCRPPGARARTPDPDGAKLVQAGGRRGGVAPSGEGRCDRFTRAGRQGAGDRGRGRARGAGILALLGTSRSRSTRWWSGAASHRARSRRGSWRSSCAGSYGG